MTILTRDETEHDTEYVLASEARQEIEQLEHTLAQLKSTTLDEALVWLRRYQEGWYGPKAQWTTEQQTDYEAHAGFLLLYIDRHL
jgi:hypothetical protein